MCIRDRDAVMPDAIRIHEDTPNIFCEQPVLKGAGLEDAEEMCIRDRSIRAREILAEYVILKRDRIQFALFLFIHNRVHSFLGTHPVSYTHLDVYKRQLQTGCASSQSRWIPYPENPSTAGH